MFLEELKIWNFRKYGEGENGDPGLIIKFHENFNLIIGENDSGKTAIIDAIKLTLGTSSIDNNKITEKDFHVDSVGKLSPNIKIECKFSSLSSQEAGMFLEWLTFNEKNEYELIVRFEASRNNTSFGKGKIYKSVKAGPENGDSRLEGLAYDLLSATYLKPLRDAENELTPGYKSRLAQILKNHPAFKVENNEDEHKLVEIVRKANEDIKVFFDEPFLGDRTIKSDLQDYLDDFFFIPTKGSRNYEPDFQVSNSKLNDILRKLSLNLDETPTGLGSLNLLFIAAELLLYDDKTPGTQLALIEEIEAHLHPQAQLRLIKYLQTVSTGQFILTTHSPTLAASVPLKHLILTHANLAYPMGPKYTQLNENDYKFLERFLDATKANLFFARGVIFVEGDAENLLLPIIAEILERPLHKYGVSIVNIGNTAFKRYTKIYLRSQYWLKDFMPLSIPVSLVTDVDVYPLAYYSEKDKCEYKYFIQSEPQVDAIRAQGIDDQVIDEMRHIVFNSKTQLSDFLGSKNLRLPSDNLDELLEILKEEINQEAINKLRKLKKQKIEDDFNDEYGYIKSFVAPNWTLEYEIALSELDEYIIPSIHEARFENPDSEANMEKFHEWRKEIHACIDIENQSYEIYKPLLKKNVSKAITAQILAEKLAQSEDKEKIKNIILKDKYLNYLKEAIYHVTEKEEN